MENPTSSIDPTILFAPNRRIFVIPIAAKDGGETEIKDIASKLSQHNKIVAVCLTSSQPALAYHRGTLSLKVGDSEVFPKEFEAKMLLSDLSVAPEERWLAIDRPTGATVEIAYKDTDSPEAAFAPYGLLMYFLCEKTSG